MVKKRSEYQEYPMPDGPEYRQKAQVFRELQKDPRYQKAVSCSHCTDTADSFNRYVSTYCHLKHEHIAGFDDKLDGCEGCPNYESRVAKLENDPRFQFAASCAYCTADVGSRFFFAYCKIEHLYLAGVDDRLDTCYKCLSYRKRGNL